MKKCILILYDISSSEISHNNIDISNNFCKIAFFDPESEEKDFDVPVLVYKLDSLEFMKSESMKNILKNENHQGIVIEQDKWPSSGTEHFVRYEDLCKDKPEHPEFSLTPTQIRVMDLLATGLQYKEIATALNLSFHTIKNHISNSYEKMGVTCWEEAVFKYLEYKRMRSW